MRGSGRSTLPPDAPEHAQSSMRAMTGDVVSLMRHLGHERFAVAGHDRGSLVAFRAAMDHPHAATRLVVMDGLPVAEHLERLNEAFVRTWWHWWSSARPRSRLSGSSASIPMPGTGRPHRPRWARAITPMSGRRYVIPRSCTACARTTGWACVSIARTSKPTGPPVAK
ncbi:MAG: alpha/beta fold hydrolase [Solirubrobacteraceae bacterium]